MAENESRVKDGFLNNFASGGDEGESTFDAEHDGSFIFDNYWDFEWKRRIMELGRTELVDCDICWEGWKGGESDQEGETNSWGGG